MKQHAVAYSTWPRGRSAGHGCSPGASITVESGSAHPVLLLSVLLVEVRFTYQQRQPKSHRQRRAPSPLVPDLCVPRRQPTHTMPPFSTSSDAY